MRSKARQVTASVSTRFQSIMRRLERWRRHRKRRSPIPEALWNAAVDLAAEYGISRTARLLRLDYYSLKERLEAGRQESLSVQKGGPAFLELVGPVVGPLSEWVVEVEHPHGGKMRMQLKGAGAAELQALANSFWKTSP